MRNIVSVYKFQTGIFTFISYVSIARYKTHFPNNLHSRGVVHMYNRIF